MSHKFNTTIASKELTDAANSALDEVDRYFAADHFEKKGAVFCQLQRREGGELYINGAFIKQERCERIGAILEEEAPDPDHDGLEPK